MFKRSQTPQGAFTLIEMLVVIGVIALLAAIMFPVFARVRENGRKAVCSSNLKQMGLAFQQYTQDYSRYPGPGNFYDGTGFAGGLGTWKLGGNWTAGNSAALCETTPPFTYPPAGQEATPPTADVEKGALFQYVKSANMFFCPSDPVGAKKRLSYSMNCAVGFLGTSRIRQPQDIVVLVDEEGPNDGYFFAVHDAGPAGSTDARSGSATAGSTDELTKRHNGGGNLLFADGHVKFYGFNEFPLDKTEVGLTNKWKATGAPRFHDRAFGPFGSNISSGETVDLCNASKRDWTTDP